MPVEDMIVPDADEVVPFPFHPSGGLRLAAPWACRAHSVACLVSEMLCWECRSGSEEPPHRASDAGRYPVRWPSGLAPVIEASTLLDSKGMLGRFSYRLR